MDNWNAENVRALIAATREENARLCAEVDELRGRLRESRRVCRNLRRESAEARARASRGEAYWRRLVTAAVCMAVALTCLAHSLLWMLV